jgi:hypothetical protein
VVIRVIGVSTRLSASVLDAFRQPRASVDLSECAKAYKKDTVSQQPI